MPRSMSEIMWSAWRDMRTAAIERHRFLNRVFERSCPVCWAGHMAIVRGFYGW